MTHTAGRRNEPRWPAAFGYRNFGGAVGGGVGRAAVTCAAPNCPHPRTRDTTLCAQHERRVLAAATWRERREVVRELGGEAEEWR